MSDLLDLFTTGIWEPFVDLITNGDPFERHPILAGCLLAAIVLLLAILVRLSEGRQNRARIAEDIKSRGGRVLEVRWSPLAPGFLMETKERFYWVRYLDRDGNECEAYCKTRFWSPVYFTEDRIVKPVAKPEEQQDIEALAAENQRLREELERLKSGHAGA